MKNQMATAQTHQTKPPFTQTHKGGITMVEAEGTEATTTHKAGEDQPNISRETAASVGYTAIKKRIATRNKTMSVATQMDEDINKAPSVETDNTIKRTTLNHNKDRTTNYSP